MSLDHPLRDFEALSPAAQQLVADLITFLHERSTSEQGELGQTGDEALLADVIAFLQRRSLSEQLERNRSHPKPPLETEPFVGMWRDRAEMQNSS
ncbi:MAG: hypothetical protein NZ693_08995, partial [Thermoflexales bacterium]|nr:hypothetical protein [Thermoflexales bacterium]